MRNTVYEAILWLIQFIEIAILARVLISWFPIPKGSQLIRILYMITEPILSPIRRIVQRSEFTKNLMIDFSPIIAFLLLQVVRNFVRWIFTKNGMFY